MATKKPAPKNPKDVRVNRGDHADQIRAIGRPPTEPDLINGKWGHYSKWSDQQWKWFSELLLLGLTDEELSAHLGIAHSTFYDWRDSTDRVFVEFVKNWREGADARVAAALYSRAVGFECTEEVPVVVGKGEVVITTVRRKYAPDVAAAFIWLKNRRRRQQHPWRDRVEEEPADPTQAAKVIQDAVAAALKTVPPEDRE